MQMRMAALAALLVAAPDSRDAGPRIEEESGGIRQLRLDELIGTRPRSDETSVCGQALYTELGPFDDWWATKPMGSGVTVYVMDDGYVSDRESIQVSVQMDSNGRFEAKLPTRAINVYVCI